MVRFPDVRGGKEFGVCGEVARCVERARDSTLGWDAKLGGWKNVGDGTIERPGARAKGKKNDVSRGRSVCRDPAVGGGVGGGKVMFGCCCFVSVTEPHSFFNLQYQKGACSHSRFTTVFGLRSEECLIKSVFLSMLL
jgi:hypothetical protein